MVKSFGRISLYLCQIPLVKPLPFSVVTHPIQVAAFTFPTFLWTRKSSSHELTNLTSGWRIRAACYINNNINPGVRKFSRLLLGYFNLLSNYLILMILTVYFGHVHMLHCFPPLVWIIKATLGWRFHRWKCEGISSVGDGHPRGLAVILSCKQEEGWLHFSSHKRGGKSPSTILFESSSRGRGDTETGSNWTHYLPSMLVFTDPWTPVCIGGIFSWRLA